MARTPQIDSTGRTRQRRAGRRARVAPLLLAAGVLLAAPGTASSLASPVAASAGPGGAAQASPERPGADGRLRLSDRLPLKADEPAGGAGWTWVRAIVMLAALGVGVAALRLLRRRLGRAVGATGGAAPRPWSRWLSPSGAGRAIRRIDVLRLTPRASLHLVRWRGEELLLAASERGVELLARATLPVEEGLRSDGMAKDGAARPDSSGRDAAARQRGEG